MFVCVIIHLIGCVCSYNKNLCERVCVFSCVTVCLCVAVCDDACVRASLCSCVCQ